MLRALLTLALIGLGFYFWNYETGVERWDSAARWLACVDWFVAVLSLRLFESQSRLDALIKAERHRKVNDRTAGG